MAIFSDVLGGYTAEDLLPAVKWQESRDSTDPTILGPMTPHGQAVGLYQILPSTGAQYGVTREQLLDPQINQQVAKEYLDDLLRHYQGNGFMALAAYNAGPHNIDRGIFPTETQGYVKGAMEYLHGYTSGRRERPAWTAKHKIPTGSPELYAMHQEQERPHPVMPPIDYSSFNPDTPLGMLFTSIGAPVGGTGELRQSEQDITKLPERSGLFGRFL